MSTDILDSVIIVLRWIMSIGIAAMAILLFWHLRRINKPVLAVIFWFVMVLTASIPLFNVMQLEIPFSQIHPLYLAWIFLLPGVMIAVLYLNPLKPIRYDYEDSEEDEDFGNSTYH